MPRKPPSWWYGGRIPAAAWGLLPLSAAYGCIVQARFAFASPYKSSLPVICIGNYTMGGAGKTPLAIAVARLLQSAGYNPAFLTRGYGGRLAGPHIVSVAGDTAARVGDEPLLLAREFATVVSRDRVEGARSIEKLGHDVIVMDDGFQNPSLVKTFSVIAVDGGVGLGCGHVFPLGPLRAPLAFQLKNTGAAVWLDVAATPPVHPPALRNLHPIMARIAPLNAAALKGGKLVAFCGIGRPAKFFETLAEAGLATVKTFAFADHHPYTESDAHVLLGEAAHASARLVTTEKDFVRLSGGSGAVQRLYRAVEPLRIRATFGQDGAATLSRLILDAIRSANYGTPIRDR